MLRAKWEKWIWSVDFFNVDINKVSVWTKGLGLLTLMVVQDYPRTTEYVPDNSEDMNWKVIKTLSILIFLSIWKVVNDLIKQPPCKQGICIISRCLQISGEANIGLKALEVLQFKGLHEIPEMIGSSHSWADLLWPLDVM